MTEMSSLFFDEARVVFSRLYSLTPPAPPVQPQPSGALHPHRQPLLPVDDN